MNNFTIKEVLTLKDEELFLDMVEAIYANDANYIRPLDNDIKNVFSPDKNDRFSKGDAKRWIAIQNNNVIARIAAFYNLDDAAKDKQPTGGVGFFECIDNQEVANLMFDTAKQWLESNSMQAMDGSINFGDRLNWWGVLVEGFTEPLYGMNYNLPYYSKLFEGYGFEVYFNQHTYRRDLVQTIRLNDVVGEKANRLINSGEYTVKCFDKKNKVKMANDFMAVYNSGWAKFEGVKPLDFKHTMKLLKNMSPIIDENVLYFAYHNETPVGFFVLVPDLNPIIKSFKGKFGLINKLRLLYNLKLSKSVRRLEGLIFGVSAQYQGKGVETILIKKLEGYIFDCIDKNKVKYDNLQMSWIGDFNPVMMRMCESYVKAYKYKRHSTYRFLFDREAIFERCPGMGVKKDK